MIAHMAETVVHGWGVDPIEDIIFLRDTNTHTHTANYNT